MAAGDAGYGDTTTFRLELGKRDWQYAVAVKGTTSAYVGEARPVTPARELKTGLGLDHFEGRLFTGWHRLAATLDST